MTDRRHFLKTAGLSLGGLAVAPRSPRPSSTRAGSFDHVRLGVASYSLRELSRADAIAAIKACGSRYVNIKSFHLPYDSTMEEIAKATREFEQGGLSIVGGGLISFHDDSDEAMRAAFDYARACGFRVIVAGPKPEVLPRLERFAVEYDVKIAIHNHGPEDAYFPAPSDALALVSGMDARMGVCVDVGHTVRTGRDVVQELALAGNRLHDIHMKDLADLSDKSSQCVVGEGQMPIRDIFAQLEIMRYPGYVNLEYEIDADNPLPGMQRSFAFMRGVLAGMSG